MQFISIVSTNRLPCSCALCCMHEGRDTKEVKITNDSLVFPFLVQSALLGWVRGLLITNSLTFIDMSKPHKLIREVNMVTKLSKLCYHKPYAMVLVLLS